MAQPQLARTETVARDGVVLVVALGGRLGVVCAASAIDAGMRPVSVPTSGEAIPRLRASGARVVVVSTTMALEEQRAIREAAAEGGAAVVTLPAVVDANGIRHQLEQAIAQSSVGREL